MPLRVPPGLWIGLVAFAVGCLAALYTLRPPAHDPNAHDPNAPREQDGQIVPALDAPAAARLTRAIDADPASKTWLATCPADAWRRRGDLTRDAPVAAVACAKAPDDCLARCLEVCLRPRLLHPGPRARAHARDRPAAAQTLYALACTSGDAAGCVNRAAGLRNSDYAGDPLRAHPLAERQVCEARSFAVGCDAAAAWGCAMRGQAFANGEGVPADPAAARRDFAAACVKDPKFAACEFARERLAEMKEAEADKAKSAR